MNTDVVETRNGKRFNNLGMEVIDCGLCGRPTTMTGTKRCDRCWELETRIKDDLKLSEIIIEMIKNEKQ